jgi:hypothetical protein
MTLKQAQQTMTDALSIMENRQVEPSSEKFLICSQIASAQPMTANYRMAYQIDVPLVTADKQLLAQFPDIAISLEKFVE